VAGVPEVVTVRVGVAVTFTVALKVLVAAASDGSARVAVEVAVPVFVMWTGTVSPPSDPGVFVAEVAVQVSLVADVVSAHVHFPPVVGVPVNFSWPAGRVTVRVGLLWVGPPARVGVTVRV
jgi:hypothetical protein